MLEGLVIREFQESDVEDVAEIFTQAGLIHDEEERKRTLEHLRRASKEPEWYDHYLLAELDGKVMGRVILEAAYPPYSELINLYVHQDYRGRGIGSSLVQRCIEMASGLKCFIISTMFEPVGNLPAHRLYSKFGFRPGILGVPSVKRGHMWLFRFSEESFLSEFLKKHPFAEPSVSSSKANFHSRMLYRMSWREPQKEDRIDFFIEGQPSQTPEGTMPRISGFSCKKEGMELEVLVGEQSRRIIQGETVKFTVSFWNHGSEPLQIAFNLSIPQGTMLSLPSQFPSTIEIGPRDEKNIEFELVRPLSCRLPSFTTFSTVLATCLLMVESYAHPLVVSAGFDKA